VKTRTIPYGLRIYCPTCDQARYEGTVSSAPRAKRCKVCKRSLLVQPSIWVLVNRGCSCQENQARSVYTTPWAASDARDASGIRDLVVERYEVGQAVRAEEFWGRPKGE
jgi:hypothetical protein